jgi:flap endonuclease-1
MGIKNLFKIISENASDAITEKKLKDYKGTTIVLDASMIIYQFVIAVRNTGNDLENSEGKMTTHIIGVINKALMLLKHDIIPIFVFDGKPPELKSNILKERKSKKNKCIQNLKEDNYDNDSDRIKDFKKSFTLSKKHIDEVKHILDLFGIPTVESLTEADPLCSHLAKKKEVYGVSSEDMDILTFGSPILIRGLSGTKKMKEISLEKTLEQLRLNQAEFIDLCILLGCDYCPTIPKIGKKRALDIIQKYRSIDTFLEKEGSKYKIPDDFNYVDARNIFMNPCIGKVPSKFKLKKPNYNEIKEVMVDIYDFNLDKVNIYINKIKTSYLKLNQNQKGGMNKYVIKSSV